MTTIAEARAFAEAAKPAEGPGALRVALITPGWGSSGYYPADVLEAAGTNKVFPAGTHMYMNHPTATENYERPVRDVTQLAAVLAEDAVWDPENPGLWANVTTFSTWREPLAEMAPYIGVSVRAGAEVEEGEAEGRAGIIVKELTEGISVDFVTRAGRGGHIAEVLEDAFSKGVVATGHKAEEAMSHDVRDSLQNLVSDAYRVADSTYVWVRDFETTANVVYFELEGAENGIFQQGFETSDDGVPTSLTGDKVEVRVSTEYVPVAAPSGQSTSTEESQEDTMPTIEESRLRELETAEAAVATLTQERNEAIARAEEAERTARHNSNLTTAQRVVNEAFVAANVEAPKTQARIAAAFPVTESGEVDEEALTTIAAESAAELAEAAGAGQVKGFGFTKPANGGDADISESDFAAGLKAISESGGTNYTPKEA